MRKITGDDAGTLYAMKVLKKATLKGEVVWIYYFMVPFTHFTSNIYLVIIHWSIVHEK